MRLSKVKELFSASNGSAGSRSIATMATAQGVKMSRYLAAKCMDKLGFVSCQQPSHAYKKSGREHVEIPNLLDRQFAVTQPNQVWCGDITYVWAGGRWNYLAVVLDLYARRVVGWAMSDKPDAELAIKALEMAYQQRGCPSGVLFHSDQGSQFTSSNWLSLLKQHGIVPSMSRRGNCHDNAVAESFFSALKKERIKRRIYPTRDEAHSDVFNYIEMFYNPVRRHGSAGDLAPVEFERRYAQSGS